MKEWMEKWQRRLGIILLGHTAKQVEEFLFDYMLYPIVIAWLGPVKGGAIMTLLSMTECFFLLRLYDWSKQDWLGFEILKEMRDREGYEGFFARVLQKAVRKSHWVAFLFLSIQGDPFMTTVYFRHGAHAYNGLSARDWKIFFASVLVSNLWWIGVVSLVVEGITFLLSLW